MFTVIVHLVTSHCFLQGTEIPQQDSSDEKLTLCGEAQEQDSIQDEDATT